MSATWPLETLSTTTFTEHAGKTTLTLRWAAHNATAEERKTFDSAHDSMTQGWGGTMAQLESLSRRGPKVSVPPGRKNSRAVRPTSITSPKGARPPADFSSSTSTPSYRK